MHFFINLIIFCQCCKVFLVQMRIYGRCCPLSFQRGHIRWPSLPCSSASHRKSNFWNKSFFKKNWKLDVFWFFQKSYFFIFMNFQIIVNIQKIFFLKKIEKKVRKWAKFHDFQNFDAILIFNILQKNQKSKYTIFWKNRKIQILHFFFKFPWFFLFFMFFFPFFIKFYKIIHVKYMFLFWGCCAVRMLSLMARKFTRVGWASPSPQVWFFSFWKEKKCGRKMKYFDFQETCTCIFIHCSNEKSGKYLNCVKKISLQAIVVLMSRRSFWNKNQFLNFL